MKKLSLNRETVRRLNNGHMGHVRGGAGDLEPKTANSDDSGRICVETKATCDCTWVYETDYPCPGTGPHCV